MRRSTLLVRPEGALTYVPTEDAEAYPPSASADGATVAYTRSLGHPDREVRRRTADGTDSLVAPGWLPSMSDDGTLVALLSTAELAAGDGAGTTDAYLVGPGGAIPLARGTGGGAEHVALSGDGSTAVVATTAGDVVPGEPGPGTYRVDVASGVATRLTDDAAGPVAISRDGSVVVATEPHATSGRQVVRFEGATRTVVESQAASDIRALDVSADGRHVAFSRRAINVTTTSALRLWSEGAGPAVTIEDGFPSAVRISADGSVVMFVDGPGPDGTGEKGDLYRWGRATGEVDWAVARGEDESGAEALDLTADGETALFLTDEILTDAAEGEDPGGYRLYAWTAP